MKQTMNVFVILFFELLSIVTTYISFCYGGSYIGCIETERQSLLKFKQELNSSNRLVTWTDDGDCCSWIGIVCDKFNSHVLELHLGNPFIQDPYASTETYDGAMLVGKINPSLLDLKHLIYLDLSGNDFEGTPIPKFLGSMRNIQYLDLSSSQFVGMIPHQLGNLSNLQYLNLNFNELWVENLHWLSGLSLLQHLDLGSTNLSEAFDWLSVTNILPSLEVLHLSFCHLYHLPLLPIANFSSLTTLDLSSNHFSNSLIPNWVFGLGHLLYLNLDNNNFQGPIPDRLQNLTSLKSLNLRSNHFNSSIPSWLYTFSGLEYLSLASNNLQGTIPDGLGNLTSIRELQLSSNTQLEGRIPKSFGSLCNLHLISLSAVKLNQEVSEILDILSGCVSNKLELLDLESCQLYGNLTNQLGKYRSLIDLSLRNNSISGPIPSSMGQLSNLNFLDLSYNKLKGSLFEIHFVNLTSLSHFYASQNPLTLKVSSDWVPSFQLIWLELRFCLLGPQFPLWLFSQKRLAILDISNSRIYDTIPSRFWESLSHTLSYFNVSGNQIYGELPKLTEVLEDASLDFSSNNFSSSLPLVSPNIALLDLSKNALSGSIFQFLCCGKNESNGLQILNLKDNFLFGELPDCWMNWQMLVVLNLNNNNFTGSIPVSLGALSSLQSLHLRKNKLSGTILESLQSCTNLEILDIGENEFVGNIPMWVGERFSKMRILNIRSNKFHGILPIELCQLAFLQILDLASNNLSGIIPRCINNFSAMTTPANYSMGRYIKYPFNFSKFGEEVFEEEILVMKGGVFLYNSILNLVRSIDFSHNKFFGEIPMEVTNLGMLQSLNLSHNFFSGRIPENIGAMGSLESIDLSANQLYGKIPQSMSSLNFLSRLNLSNNKLVGEIPSSTQLQSLDASSFIGNELCGPPLQKSCTVTVPTPKSENGGAKDGNEEEVNWFYLGIPFGFVVGFWSVIAPLIVKRRWRYKYYDFLEHLGDKFGCLVRNSR